MATQLYYLQKYPTLENGLKTKLIEKSKVNVFSAVHLYMQAVSLFVKQKIHPHINHNVVQDIIGLPMPSQLADDVWHEMILNTHFYQEFCKTEFGHFIHHNPQAQDVLSYQEYMIEHFMNDNKQQSALMLLFVLCQMIEEKPISHNEIIQSVDDNQAINNLFQLIENKQLLDLVLQNLDDYVKRLNQHNFITTITSLLKKNQESLSGLRKLIKLEYVNNHKVFNNVKSNKPIKSNTSQNHNNDIDGISWMSSIILVNELNSSNSKSNNNDSSHNGNDSGNSSSSSSSDSSSSNSGSGCTSGCGGD